MSGRHSIRPIHAIPLDEFIGGGRYRKSPDMVSESFLTHNAPRIYMAEKRLVERAIPYICDRIPTNIPGFNYGVDEFNTMVVIWDQTNNLAAYATPGVNFVFPQYRGKKLGRELAILTFETGQKSTSSQAIFSPGGLASRKSAHRFCVERAVQQGLPIPEPVKLSYPDFAKLVSGALEPQPTLAAHKAPRLAQLTMS
jgi:hypothetical protein